MKGKTVVSSVFGPTFFVEDVDNKIEELEQVPALEELELLKSFKMGVDVGSWTKDTQFISESSFEEYARQYAEEIYETEMTVWPFTFIDWDEAAQELKKDFKTIEFEGETYWYKK